MKLGNSSKSKSTKSLKVKNKSSPKTDEQKSAKKIKPKHKKSNQSDTKTVKKIKNLVKANLSEESFNS